MLLVEIFQSEETQMTRIPCPEDPRGYVVLLGNDLDKEYTWGPKKITVSGAVEFETHVSFTINRSFNIIVSSSEKSLECMVINLSNDEIVAETSFKNTSEMYNFLAMNYSDHKLDEGSAV